MNDDSKPTFSQYVLKEFEKITQRLDQLESVNKQPMLVADSSQQPQGAAKLMAEELCKQNIRLAADAAERKIQEDFWGPVEDYVKHNTAHLYDSERETSGYAIRKFVDALRSGEVELPGFSSTQVAENEKMRREMHTLAADMALKLNEDNKKVYLEEADQAAKQWRAEKAKLERKVSELSKMVSSKYKPTDPSVRDFPTPEKVADDLLQQCSDLHKIIDKRDKAISERDDYLNEIFRGIIANCGEDWSDWNEADYKEILALIKDTIRVADDATATYKRKCERMQNEMDDLSCKLGGSPGGLSEAVGRTLLKLKEKPAFMLPAANWMVGQSCTGMHNAWDAGQITDAAAKRGIRVGFEC